MGNTRTFYYPSQEKWEKFKEKCEAKGSSVSRVLSEAVDDMILGDLTLRNVPSLNTFFGNNPNSIEAVQLKIRELCLERAKKQNGNITLREIRDYYIEAVPTPDIRNAVTLRTKTYLAKKGVKVWL